LIMGWTNEQFLRYETRRAPKKPFDPTGCKDERELHNQIFNECRRRGWIPLHGSMSERTHRTEGEPDFTIIAQGRVIFIEAKTATGKLSIAQQGMITHAAKLGITIHVIRSFEDFIKICDS